MLQCRGKTGTGGFGRFGCGGDNMAWASNRRASSPRTRATKMPALWFLYQTPRR
jgi:hypothetical protein